MTDKQSKTEDDQYEIEASESEEFAEEFGVFRPLLERDLLAKQNKQTEHKEQAQEEKPKKKQNQDVRNNEK